MAGLSASFSLLLSRIFRRPATRSFRETAHFRAFRKRESVFWGHEQFLAPLVSVGTAGEVC
jgi:hypothetical protein